MSLKKKILAYFDSSIGKLIRLFQSSLIPRENKPRSVIDLVEEMSRQESASYALQEMQNSLCFRKKEDLWRYCLNLIEDKGREENRTVQILEFGVWTGYSINYMAGNCPEAFVVGFDSFEGLEEDWIGTPLAKKAFHLKGKTPKVGSNVELVIGKFEESLPRWLAQNEDRKIDLVHIDSDTYKPAKFVLNMLVRNLEEGSIIIFDEYFGYPSWRLNEWRAWQEIVKSLHVEYRYLAFSDQSVAIQLISQKVKDISES